MTFPFLTQRLVHVLQPASQRPPERQYVACNFPRRYQRIFISPGATCAIWIGDRMDEQLMYGRTVVGLRYLRFISLRWFADVNAADCQVMLRDCSAVTCSVDIAQPQSDDHQTR